MSPSFVPTMVWLVMFCLLALRLASSLFVIVGATSLAALSLFLAAAVAVITSFFGLVNHTVCTDHFVGCDGVDFVVVAVKKLDHSQT